MRSASSYRGAKKKAAREAKVPFGQFNEHYQRSRHFAAAEIERAALNATPEAARKALDALGEAPLSAADARRKLAQWAANGGRATAVSPAIEEKEMEAMNVVPKEDLDDAQIAAKIKLDDIDKALEAALSRWQAEGHTDPLPLSPLFAARARQIGWAEDVEFVEERPKR